MSHIVVVAEKPSVGMSIAKVLGCRQREDGYISNDKYIVTWAIGHLCELQDPGEIDEKYKKWDFATLPILPENIPLKVNADARKQYKIVEKLLNAADTSSVVCATDAGREGELIFRYIYIMSRCKKDFKRLWISSMTDQAIREGFNSLRPGRDYDDLYQSARCRSEADWIVGMNASRAFSIKHQALLSVGRVQTPTLAFLVKRKQEIDEFKPEPYATLTADFGDYKGIMFSEKLKPDTHIPQVSQAQTVANIIKGKPAKVTKAETQRKKENPPQLFDLTSLQREANRRFGYTADNVLKIAQSLYEKHKALTYPRTDSRYLTNDMIPVVPSTMKTLPEEYQKYVPGALKDGKVEVTKRVFDESKVSDHHAIIPTTQTAPLGDMNEGEKKIFDLVARRFLAAFYPPCEYDSTKIITTADRFNFRTIGKTIIIPGWREVTTGDTKIKDPSKEDDEPENDALPPLKEGDMRTVQDAIVEEKFTKPPANYTDASLLTAMETAGKESDDEEIVQMMKGHGIGTPATRAQIIERIISVGYAERQNKSIVATNKGVALIKIMPPEITSAETTGRWEIALDKIADRKQDPKSFMESIRRFAIFLVNHAKEDTTEIDSGAFDKWSRKASTAVALEDLKCPVCGKGHIVEHDTFFGCSEWKKDGTGCGFSIWKDLFRKRGADFSITKDMLTELLNNGVSNKWDGGTVYYNTDSGQKSIYVVKNDAKVVSDIISVENRPEHCPSCNRMTVNESVWNYSCSNCHMTIWKNSFSKEGFPGIMTRSMFQDLLTEGKTEARVFGTGEMKGYFVMDDGKLKWYASGACDPERDTPIAETQLASTYTGPKKTTKGKGRGKGTGKKRTTKK